MPKIYLPRVVDHPHQLVVGVFGRLVVVVCYQFGQIQVDRRLNPVVEFRFSVLPVRKSFYLEHQDLGKAVQIYFPFALFELFVKRWVLLHFPQ